MYNFRSSFFFVFLSYLLNKSM